MAAPTAHVQFLRGKKLHGKNIIHVAAKHNLRELQAEIGGDGHIDPARTPGNYVLRGEHTAAGVAATTHELLSNAGLSRPLRKNAVRGLEIIFSVRPESELDYRQFFEDSVAWAERHFPCPMLSAIVHLDEAAPHCHVLLLPLVEGRMIGSELFGNRATLRALQSDFFAQVGQRYGLTRQSAPKRLSGAIRRQATSLALETIQANPSCLNKPSVRQAIADVIAINPDPLLMALDLPMPTPAPAKVRTFAAIMTKPCKPEPVAKPVNKSIAKPIGFQPTITNDEQTLCSVGFTTSPPAISYTRHRDSDEQSGYWDSDTGEFIRYPTKRSNTRLGMS